MTTPNFLVVGAGRAGTTGLVEGLRTHPRVFVTSPKEPHYFGLHDTRVQFQGPGDDATINRVAMTDRASYLTLYADTDGFLARGDGSVSTLYYAGHAVPEILDMNPQMRLVVMLREPVDRAYSSYLYMRGRGFEPCDRFSDALDDEERRRELNWHHLWHYTAMSRYADGLSRLQNSVGRDRVGVWFYDDLQARYAAVVSEVLRFLDVPPDDAEAVGVGRVNVSGTPRNALVHRAIPWLTRNEALRSTVKKMTSFEFRERLRRSSLRPSSVPPEVREQVTGRFDEDLRRVGELVDGPVPDWLARHRLPDSPGRAQGSA